MDSERIIVIENAIYSISEGKIVKASGWKLPSEDPIHQRMLNNISIGNMHPMYIEVNDIQVKKDEYQKIENFLYKFMVYYADKKGISIEELTLTFINYGKTELVYVLTEKNGNRVTLLVKQPAVLFGMVKKEVGHLLELQQIDSRVVAPIDYFTYGNQELYVTPYIKQARCVASYGTWGMYIPEPYYRFESFTEEQEQIVTTCMIAKLVSFYNFKSQEGICSCKLGGGDFMLPKGWEREIPTIENTLDNLYFIAARDTITCSFDEYLEMIRNEFSRSTINENQENLVINLRGRVPMTLENIENGIHLGKKIVTNRSIGFDESFLKEGNNPKIKKRGVL